jgi:hypothetical protein
MLKFRVVRANVGAPRVRLARFGGNFSHHVIRNRQQFGLYFLFDGDRIITHRLESIVKKR